MTTNPENRTIGEPLTQFSILLPDSKNIQEGLAWNASNRKIAPKLKNSHKSFKTKSGSHSALDASI